MKILDIEKALAISDEAGIISVLAFKEFFTLSDFLEEHLGCLATPTTMSEGDSFPLYSAFLKFNNEYFKSEKWGAVPAHALANLLAHGWEFDILLDTGSRQHFQLVQLDEM